MEPRRLTAERTLLPELITCRPSCEIFFPECAPVGCRTSKLPNRLFLAILWNWLQTAV